MPWLSINNLARKNSTLLCMYWGLLMFFVYGCLKVTVMELFIFCGICVLLRIFMSPEMVA